MDSYFKQIGELMEIACKRAHDIAMMDKIRDIVREEIERDKKHKNPSQDDKKTYDFDYFLPNGNRSYNRLSVCDMMKTIEKLDIELHKLDKFYRRVKEALNET